MHGKFNALMVTPRCRVGVVPYLNGAHPRGAGTSQARVYGVCGGLVCGAMGLAEVVAVCM